MKSKFEVLKGILGVELIIFFMLTVVFFGAFDFKSNSIYETTLRNLAIPLYVSASPILLLLIVTQALIILFSYKGKNKVLRGLTKFFETIFEVLYRGLYEQALTLDANSGNS